MNERSHGPVISFGKFDVNLATGELRKSGQRIRIQPQPMKVLAMLLERPGDLVTREELRKRLWPGELYVDFEHGLNRSINKLRSALLDDAGSPTYIETLSTRGYRFIATVDSRTAPKDAGSESKALPIGSSRNESSPIVPIELVPHEPRDVAAKTTPKTKKFLLADAWWSAPPSDSSLNRRLIVTVGVLFLAALVLASTWHPRHVAAPLPTMNQQLRPVPLVTFADGAQWLPAFSPDGSRIAYSLGTKAGGYLEVKDVGGESRIRLTPKPSNSLPGPAWSPDGRQIAFARIGDSDDRGIFLISALGGPERKLRSLSPWHLYQRVLSWSPDGHWIAFADEIQSDSLRRPSGRGPNAIYLISPETLETRQLTRPLPGDFGDTVPTFSPDGTTIAFIRTGADSNDAIFIIPVAGGVPHRLVNSSWTDGLTWTADGKWIIFDRDSRLWRVSVAETETQPIDIPSNGESLGSPTVWQDRLAYESHQLMRTVGRIALNKVNHEPFDTPVASTRHEKGGQYSPDGRHIAFISDRTGVDEMWMTDSDGSNPVQLTHLDTPLSSLSWSPHANAIALITESGKVFLISLENSAPKLVQQGVPFFEDDRPKIAFSRSGDYIYVLSQPGNTGESFELLKVPVAGGVASKVLVGRLTNFGESSDGSELFYSLEDRLWDLWKCPAAGGPAKFLGPTSYGRWTVGPEGLYLLTSSSSLELYSLDGKRLRTLAKVDKDIVDTPLSISPDGHWALFGYQQRRTTEIDMVKGFSWAEREDVNRRSQ